MVNLHTETLSNSKALEFSHYDASTIIIAITDFRLSSMPLIICGSGFKLDSFQEEGAPLFLLSLLSLLWLLSLLSLLFFVAFVLIVEFWFTIILSVDPTTDQDTFCVVVNGEGTSKESFTSPNKVKLQKLNVCFLSVGSSIAHATSSLQHIWPTQLFDGLLIDKHFSIFRLRLVFVLSVVLLTIGKSAQQQLLGWLIKYICLPSPPQQHTGLSSHIWRIEQRWPNHVQFIHHSSILHLGFFWKG